jgi:hypothetical protein
LFRASLWKIIPRFIKHPASEEANLMVTFWVPQQFITVWHIYIYVITYNYIYIVVLYISLFKCMFIRGTSLYFEEFQEANHSNTFFSLWLDMIDEVSGGI